MLCIEHEIRPAELRELGASRRAWRYASSPHFPCHMRYLKSKLFSLDVREGVFNYATLDGFLEALDRLGEEMEKYEQENDVDLGHHPGSDTIFEEYWYGIPP